MRQLLIDSGPLIATYSPGDIHHERCVTLLSDWPGELVIPEPVLAETCGFLRHNLRRGGLYEADLLEHVALGTGDFTVTMPTAEDLRRSAELVRRMTSAPLGYVDAIVIAMAERLHITDVATVDTKLSVWPSVSPKSGRCPGCSPTPTDTVSGGGGTGARGGAWEDFPGRAMRELWRRTNHATRARTSTNRATRA